ncbi:uncharacterized protein RCC_07084 [Ramularia collo-cygni]|uniref:Uncharacterized protein n=1 Tax=Ramularia collo-cygni TaxID=112498 RepID=A0A2D3UUC8_9PEZI|nr:uncharacterized protein RCC_07084 [Ramularia collo-cygni]CZT21222.1 uncharacterized protein RCC_07084 [Ramularia collo-cygni]
MARTKQTARRSTGGKPPRKHRKAEQEIARRQAAVKQAETMDVESDAESHCSSLSSAKSLGSPPPRDGPSEEQEGDAVTAAPEDEEEDATIKHEPRNSLPAPAGTVTHSERPLDVPTFPATRKVDTTSTAQGEEMVEHEDGDEVEELGYFMSNIFAFRVPAAPRDEIGNWLPVSLYHCIGARSCDVYDSNMIKFGWLSIPNSSALWQLLVDTHSTKFRHNLELAARGSYGIEQIGDMSTRDLKAKITVFAAKRAAGHVLAELETQGVQIRRAGDGDVIVRSGPDLDEFDAETVAQKATSRLTQEDEFEPTHSPKSKATTDQVEPMVTESQPSEQRRDGEPVKILSTSPPLQASETTKGLSATDPIGDRAVQHGSHTATIRSAEDDIDPQGAAVIGTSTSTMSLEEASSAPAEASEAHQEEVPAMATPVETREERSPAQATAEGVQQTTLPAPPIIMEVQQEASLEQMLPAENRENAAVNGEALPSEVDASKHQQNIPPPQSTPAIEQEEMSSMIPPATPYDEEDVDDFLSFTHTKSKEVALQYLIAGGSLSKALRNFRKDQVAHKPTEQASQSLQDEAKPCTLIDEALDAYATMPAPTNRGRQDEGNTLVVLDGVNLGRNCRINFTDLYAAMPIAEARLTATDDGSLEVRGVRHLYFLLKPINGEMPKLERIRLSTTMEDCRDMIFTLPTASDDMESAGRSASGD